MHPRADTIFAKLFIATAFFVGGFVVAAPAQAALTPTQVSTILTLLASFNVDQATIANVRAALGGGAASTGPVGSVSFAAAVQPAEARIAPSSKGVPFTTFTLSNNTGKPVTVEGVTVTRLGTASDSSLTGVELVDSAGTRIGSARTLDYSHQATVGGTFTLQAGEAKTLTVVGTIASKSKARSGRTISLQVGAINVSAALYGSLPIDGTSYTIDTKLTPSVQ